MDIPKNQVISIMGPSGCGKTTFLRGINRMHELVAGATSSGKILLNTDNVYELSPILVRLKIGMGSNTQTLFPI